MSVAKFACDDCGWEWFDDVDFCNIYYCPRCGTRVEIPT